MKSEMAAEDLEEMREDGLNPTIDDIIRLNALGLKCELSRDCGEMFAMPRVAFLGNVAFREPTVGHGIWMDAVLEYCDTEDLSTMIAVRAFALSRRHFDLPDAADRDRCSKAIDYFTKNDLAPFTFRQVHCAVTYAMHGNSAIEMEFPVPQPDEVKMEDDAALSVGAGVIVETLAMGLGISVRDISAMTISNVRQIQIAGLMRQGVNVKKSAMTRRLAEYYTTKDAIVERLTKEVKK